MTYICCETCGRTYFSKQHAADPKKSIKHLNKRGHKTFKKFTFWKNRPANAYLVKARGSDAPKW